MAEKGKPPDVESEDKIKICKACNTESKNMCEYAEHTKGKPPICYPSSVKRKYLESKGKFHEKDSEDEITVYYEKLSISDETSNPLKKAIKVIEKSVEPCSNDKSSIGEEISSNGEDSYNYEAFTCRMCKIVCTSRLLFRNHLKGKRHLRNLKKLTFLKEKKLPVLLPDCKHDNKGDSLKTEHPLPNSECKVCRKKYMGSEAFKQLCKSDSLEINATLEKVNKCKAATDLSIKVDNAGNSTCACCKICNKRYICPSSCVEPKWSSSHLKQHRHDKELAKIENPIINNQEDLKCEGCA